MKNLLKNKKVLIGGGVVLALGLIAYYYDKGKKVLNSSSNSFSNADGSLLFADNSRLSLLNASNVFGAGNSNVSPSRLDVIGQTNSNMGNMFVAGGSNVASSRMDALATSLLQYRELQSGQSSNAVATPIVTNQGILIKPNGILQPIGIGGFFTTLQAGLTGSPSVALINDIQTKTQAMVQARAESLKK
jgi:hypothetical protein